MDNKIALVFKAIELIPRFLPKPTPPHIDYSELYASIPKVQVPDWSPPSIRLPQPPRALAAPVQTVVEPASRPAIKEEVSTACLSCSRSHLSTVSGALGEAIRFAREEGIEHPEVQRRLNLAEDEINIMERIDLSPDALSRAEPREKQVAEEYLPKIRRLRQQIGEVTSFPKLEEVAADASLLGQEFRLRHLQLRGVDLNPVIELAKMVKAGEISMDEAKARLKAMIPEEDEEE